MLLPDTVLAVAGAAGAVASRERTLRLPALNRFVVRGVGFYVAAAAGSVQLLDILVDRFGWSERVIILVVIAAIVGLPVVAAVCLILDAAGEERTPVRPVSARPRVHAAGAAPAPAAGAAADAAPPGTAAGTHSGTGAGARTPATEAGPKLLAEPVALTGRIDLALSHRRIAAAHAAGDDNGAAAPHLLAFLAEAERVRADLDRLIEEARRRAGTGGAPGQAS